jgi:hypothetical protein
MTHTVTMLESKPDALLILRTYLAMLVGVIYGE